jgi:hypothetical protein
MKHFTLFLLALAVFGISISGVNAQNYYGFYTGAVTIMLPEPESSDGITVELATDGPDNYLRFEEIDFGAGPIAPELDQVIITPNGGGYSISRDGEISITIPEIEIPPYGTLENLLVKIKLTNGSLINNEMTLEVSMIAMLFDIIPLSVGTLTFVGNMHIQEPIYDPVAVACINAMIENNGLDAEPDQPEDWDFAEWIYGDTLQLVDLDLDHENLSGSLSLVGLSQLESLYCPNNHLTEIILTGCTHLEEIYCYLNHLTAIDLTGLDALTDFAGEGQTIALTLDNDGIGIFTCAIPLNDPTFTEDVISYKDGILQSTNSTIASTYFTVETGNSEFQLSGMMSFTYTGVGIAETQCIVPSLVYPNPTTGELQITNYELQITNVEVYDVYGKKVSQISYPKSHISNLIDISHLQAGTYFLLINTEKGSIMQKVVKQYIC